MKTSYPPITVSQTFSTASEIVWRAITNVDQMKQWYFPVITSFEAKIGFETRFTVLVEDRIFPHVWKITEVVPNKKIAYQWTFDGYSGKALTHWELQTLGAQTKLTLTSEILEPFPENIPEFKRESGLAGWTYLIKESLVNYIEGK